eukprot:13161-Heterococcus_DN1.PRE.2
MRGQLLVFCLACSAAAQVAAFNSAVLSRACPTALAGSSVTDLPAVVLPPATVEPAVTTRRRKSTTKRRPHHYYSQLDNVRSELRTFWATQEVTSEAVPSNLLLHYYGAWSIVHGIRLWGGAEQLAKALQVSVIPSKWSKAILTEEVQVIIAKGLLSPEIAAAGPKGGAAGLRKYGATAQQKCQQLMREATEARQVKGACIGDKREGIPQLGYKPYNFWANSGNLQQELFAFLREYQPAIGQPTVWLPRSIQFAQAGRNDLNQAIRRHGGQEAIGKRYGLVPYSHWQHFEKQLTVFKGLQSYIVQFGTPGYMPMLTDIEDRGWCTLKDGIAYLGGAKALAAKFCLRIGRKHSDANINLAQKQAQRRHNRHASNDDDCEHVYDSRVIYYKVSGYYAHKDTLGLGAFDLEFAIDLLEYIKSVNYRRSLGEASAAITRGDADKDWWDSKITMPFRYDLLEDGQEQLVAKIEQYGGFENVARRLQLEYRDKDLKELTRVRARDAPPPGSMV